MDGLKVQLSSISAYSPSLSGISRTGHQLQRPLCVGGCSQRVAPEESTLVPGHGPHCPARTEAPASEQVQHVSCSCQSVPWQPGHVPDPSLSAGHVTVLLN